MLYRSAFNLTNYTPHEPRITFMGLPQKCLLVPLRGADSQSHRDEERAK